MLVRISHKPCIEHVVVILTVVKTDKPILKKILDVMRCRVNQLNRSLVLTGCLVNHNKQIREYLNIEKYNRLFGVLVLGGLIRLELHLCKLLDAVVRVMRTLGCKYKDVVSHVAHVILKT